MMMVNQKVSTPLGDGIVQGGFAVVDAGREIVSSAVLVRLPINDVTRAELNKSYCMTPTANVSGLWVFDAGEIK